MSRTGAAPSSIPFVDRLAGFGPAPALVTAAGTLTYAELADRVDAARRGLGRQRRLVLVEAVNDVECLVFYLAALAGRHPVILTPASSAASADLVARYDPDIVARRGAQGWHVEERRAGSRHVLHPDLALLLSTSGSAGSPKLVRLSAENLQSNAEAIATSLGIDTDDRAITSLPMSYCYGLSVVHSHLARGASLVLTDLSVLDRCFWDAVREHGVTSFAGVPYTFDLLDRCGFADLDLPSLRYVTQAGGRLGPDRVARYGDLGRRRGWDFVVMYGQTEATARMAYLPPSLNEARAGAVGVPVPGGAFRIDPVADDSGAASTDLADVGEVVYTGPNVMLGYAEAPDDLARGRVVSELRTGDLGRISADGLLEITGRRTGFLKILGVRVDLGRVDAVLASLGVTACSTGDDARLDVAVEGCEHPPALRSVVASEIGLAPSAVRVVPVEAIPRLTSGKPDRAATRALLERIPDAGGTGAGPRRSGSQEAEGVPAAVGPVGTAATRDATDDVGRLVRLFADVLDRPDATPDSTFVGLGGDSLSFVSLSVNLEDALGELPENWHVTPIRELARPRRPVRSFLATVETGLALRAAAIVAVVGTHAGLFTLRGGAHLLLGVAGYNFARFTLATDNSRERARRVGRGIARVAVPSMLWIASVAVLTGAYLPSTALLLNNVLGPDRWGPDWHFWYVEALVWILAAVGGLLALPAIGRWQRRWPFAFALSLLAIGLAPRFELVEVSTGPERGTPQFIFWLFALGWATAAASRSWQRALLSAIALLTVPGFFDARARDVVVVVGLLALVWLPTVPLPRRAVRVVGVLASSSLYIYLTQWQVYPLLDGVPALALAASLAVGVAAWAAAHQVQRWATTARRTAGRANPAQDGRRAGNDRPARALVSA